MIRYQYVALFPNLERRGVDQVFVFDREGRYIGHETRGAAAEKAMHPLVGNFSTVDQDGGPTWQEARAIKDNTWFVGHFSRRRDERWYKLEVSADVTYALFVDDENGSGKYNADPAFDIYEPAFAQELVALFGQSVPCHHAEPLGLLFALTVRGGICPVSGNRERSYRLAIRSETHFWFAANIPYNRYLV